MPAKGWAKLSPDELEQKTEAYFQECKDTLVDGVSGKTVIKLSRPPTVEGMALHLGINRDTLYAYKNGEYPSEDKDTQKRVSGIITRAIERMTQDTLEGAMVGRYDARIAGLVLGHRGYSTKAEIAHSGGIEVKLTGATTEQVNKWSK